MTLLVFCLLAVLWGAVFIPAIDGPPGSVFATAAVIWLLTLANILGPRAVGISSMLLSEMAACGVPSASLQWPGTDPAYYCLPFEDFGIARLHSVEALERWLAAAPGAGAPGIRSSVHASSIERITAWLIGEAERPRG